MVTVERHMGSLNFSTQLSDVKNLLDKAQAETTFWGSRVIKVQGFTGSVYLDDVAKKILEAGRTRCRADDLTPEERVAGIEIVGKLQNFYQMTDKQIQNSCFLTRFFCWIREFTFDSYARFHIEDPLYDGTGDFRAYSEEKFLAEFGGSYTDLRRHPASNGSFQNSSFFRIVAREDRIRELLIRG